jgi:importin subunit beta-1
MFQMWLRKSGVIYFPPQGYEDAELVSFLLTPYLPNVIPALLTAANHGDMAHFRFRLSAYEALNEIVRVSKIPETSSIIGQLLREIMRRLNITFDRQIYTSGDKEKQRDLQALMCGVLQVIIQKLSSSEAKSIIAQTADQLMLLFLRVFSGHSAIVHEEAMLVVGALAYASGPDFVKYMPEFFKYLEAGL